jgi:uroporphyrinogen-III synthase
VNSFVDDFQTVDNLVRVTRIDYRHARIPGMSALDGTRIALLESHQAADAAAHVQRFGGVPHCVAAVREIRHVDRVPNFIDRLASDRVALVLFLTDTGATILLDEASRLGRRDDVVAALRRTTIACRGPKPAAVLRRSDVPSAIVSAAPHTSRELLSALAGAAVAGRDIAIISGGTRASAADPVAADAAGRAVADALAARGARVDDLPLYEWTMPEDLTPLRQLVADLVAGRFDAIAFTNRIQSRHLFRAADDLGAAAALTNALNGNVIVAVVGPVCAEALQAAGVAPDIIPARATMESMIAALAEYVELTRDLPD